MVVNRLEGEVGVSDMDDGTGGTGELHRSLSEIDTYFRELILVLEQRRDELKAELNHVAREKVESLRIQQEQLHKFLSRAYESICMAEEVLDLDDQQLVSEANTAIDHVDMVLSKQRRCTLPVTSAEMPMKLDTEFHRRCATLGTVLSYDKEMSLSKLDDPSMCLPNQSMARVTEQKLRYAPLKSTAGSKTITIGNGNGTGNGQFAFAYGLTVDNYGRLIVADTHNNRVQIFDEHGVFLSKFGTPGTADGQFAYPSAIAVDSLDRIIVVEDGNHRAQVFEPDGTFLFRFGGHGQATGQFTNPYGVAVDGHNRMIITDYSNNRVQVFDENGTFLFKFGTPGNGDGQFNGPTGVTVNNQNRIIVSDHNNNRVQIFDENGQFLHRFGEGKLVRPWGVAVDDSHIVVAECGNHRVFVFKSDGSALWSFGSRGSAEGQFIGPLGLVIDSKGRIVVADNYNHRLQVLE
jgi:hypothetical protein